MRADASLTPPKLRIVHLFLWTAAAALVLLVIRPALEEPHGSLHRATMFRALYAAYSVIGGVFVAGLLYWMFAIGPRIVLARAPTESWGRHPGHWLLLLGGIETVCGHLAALVLRLFGQPREFPDIGAFFVAGYLVSTLVTVALWIHLAWRADWSATWRIGVLVLAFMRTVCCFASPWGSSAAVIGSANFVANEMERSDLVIPLTLPTIAFAGLFLVAPLDDWRRSTPRDLFHYVGLVSTLLLFVWIWCWAGVVSWVH
ncbi:MAG TPA: hypothetical protein VMP01_06275 [Pirellulaceae bacterium]|nr:hypothetical protein [Pirellulaceae bacterium]